MKVVILAGGHGTRLAEQTDVKPKPMVEIGGWPIIWHIMNNYAAQGHKEFLLALGYKGEVIKHFFYNYYYLHHDFSLSLKNGKVKAHKGVRQDWKIHLVDTGLNTGTGGRVKRLKSWIGRQPFLMTYGDGVANVDIRKLIQFHRRHGKLATVTAVRPPARFGGMQFKGNMVTQFLEKPQAGEGWINGGFFVLEPEVLDYIKNDEMMFEREPLERLARSGELAAYKHADFWQCMDTLRDLRLLESLWQNNKAPWKVWR